MAKAVIASIAVMQYPSKYIIFAMTLCHGYHLLSSIWPVLLNVCLWMVTSFTSRQGQAPCSGVHACSQEDHLHIL